MSENLSLLAEQACAIAFFYQRKVLQITNSLERLLHTNEHT